MTPEEFKRLLANCRCTDEIDRLLQNWSQVKASLDELAVLRHAVIARYDHFIAARIEGGGTTRPMEAVV